MITRLLWLMVVVLAAACQQAAIVQTRTPVRQTPTSEPQVVLDVDGLELTLDTPQGWEVMQTDYGVVLAENPVPMEMGGLLNGMVVHVFVHPVDELITDDPRNQARMALDQVVSNPVMIGDAAVSVPAGFEWDGHDAAYYLLNKGDGNLTLLVAVALPRTNQIVVCSASAPVQDSYRIRQMLPSLLDGLTVNGVQMHGTALEALPDPLEFPVYNRRHFDPNIIAVQ